MDIYLSYKNIDFKVDKNRYYTGAGSWEPLFEKQKNIQKSFLKINFNLLKLNYKNIYLVTDKASAPDFEKLEFSNIYTVLDDIPHDYLEAVPALFKLYVYNYISKKNKPFAHIDNDFFITRRLPEDFINSEVFCQSIDKSTVQDIGIIGFELSRSRKERRIKKSHPQLGLNYYHNCGIIGGKNCSFFERYSSSAIEFVLDKKNSNFWLCNYPIFGIDNRVKKSIFAEQIHLTSFAEKNNIDIKVLFEDHGKFLNYGQKSVILDMYKKTGCFHLYPYNKYFFFKDMDLNYYELNPLEFFSVLKLDS